MKKTIVSLLAAMLVLSMVSGALAELPAAGSLKLEELRVGRNSAWKPEGYPQIVVTPFYPQYVLEKKDVERYPTDCLTIAPPEGAVPYAFDYDYATFVNFDTFAQYSYQCFDRASFELFMEKAEAEHTLADGSEGVAMYVAPDKSRAYAMLDLKAEFGGTAKLRIDIYLQGSDPTAEELTKVIQDEVARVKGSMKLEKPSEYWSSKVFASVDLVDTYLNVKVTVDTKDMTIARVDDNRVRAYELVGDKVIETEISLGTLYHEASELQDTTMADGTPYKLHASEYSCQAFFLVKKGESKEEYVQVKIGVEPDKFADALEKVYPLLTMPKAE